MECPICLEDIENNKCTTTCNHTFHTECLMACSIKNNINCPLCRSNIINLNNDYNDYNDKLKIIILGYFGMFIYVCLILTIVKYINITQC